MTCALFAGGCCKQAQSDRCYASVYSAGNDREMMSQVKTHFKLKYGLVTNRIGCKCHGWKLYGLARAGRVSYTVLRTDKLVIPKDYSPLD